MRKAVVAVAVLLAGCGGAGAMPAGGTPGDAWVPAWLASPSDVGNVDLPAGAQLRQTITSHAAGSRVRMQLSNRLGTETLSVAKIMLRDGTLLFDGAEGVDVPAGESRYSDPLELSVEAFERLPVTLTFADAADALPRHYQALERVELALPGAPFVAMPFDSYSSWFAISALEVSGGPAREAIVALGDSITDGYVPAIPCAGIVTSPAIFGQDDRYPDFLQERLVAAGRPDLSVVNAGISGNRVNDDGFASDHGPELHSRIADDVLAYPNVRTVILLEGINDLGLQVLAPDAQALIDGLDEAVRSLQAAGKRVLLGTITPGRGFCMGPLGEIPLLPGVLSGSAAVDAARQMVNDWIRTSSSADAIVDFDACVRDPSNPSYLANEFDSGDNLHPNVSGYEALATCVPLNDL